MNLENQNILITSNEPWSDVWFSKHNYAWELAKKNTVFFINSPGKWKLRNVFRKIEKKIITNNLAVLNLENILPSSFFLLKELNNFVASLRIRKFLKKERLNNWLLWSFTPLFLFRPRLIHSKLALFHIVDQNWTTFYGTRILTKQADVLIFVSGHLLPEYSFTTKKKLVVEHGISEEEIIFDEKKNAEIKKEINSYIPFGLYVGIVDRRFDFKFFAKMVDRFKNIFFVIVGPLNISEDHPFQFLFNGQTKNVITLGKKPYKELKYYIQQSKFCISPMDLTYSGNDISHHKTLSYLIQGKPVFSPVFKAYKDVSPLMYLNNDPEELISSLARYLEHGESETLIKSRADYAKQFLFTNHLVKIEAFINEIHPLA